MKTAIVGSRSFKDFALMNKKLQDFDISHVVSGGAPGADTLAEAWAISEDKLFTIFRPNWTKYGKSADFIRNKEIVENCDRLIAFWDGYSKGTANSIDVARALKKEVHIILV